MRCDAAGYPLWAVTPPIAAVPLEERVLGLLVFSP
jgi:hypothetical protein